MSKKIYVHKIEKTISDLKRNKEKFTIEKTRSTTTLKYSNIILKNTVGNFIKPKELGFLNKVLKYVQTHSAGINVDRKNIHYIKQGKLKLNRVYTSKIYEIDLNSAYWNFAYKSNYISKQIYEDGLKVSKVCRLVSLGNLAKTTTVLSFDGDNYKHEGVIKSESTEGVFFDVSKQTDDVMNMLRVIANKNFMFYWVDAIFFQTDDTKNDIIEYLQDLNIPYKIKVINKVKLEPYLIKVWDDKKLRLFNFKKENNLI
jgi:hypothetical protein